MSHESDPDLAAAVSQAAIAMLGKDLRGDTGGDPAALERSRRAAVEICRQAGVLDLLRAISADGELRPPPPWPEADIVPVGGGAGFLNVEVRTFAKGGIVRVPLRMAISRKPTQAEIGEAWEYGKFRLRGLLGA
jgi:hypothetical protein